DPCFDRFNHVCNRLDARAAIQRGAAGKRTVLEELGANPMTTADREAVAAGSTHADTFHDVGVQRKELRVRQYVQKSVAENIAEEVSCAIRVPLPVQLRTIGREAAVDVHRYELERSHRPDRGGGMTAKTLLDCRDFANAQAPLACRASALRAKSL